MSEPRSPLSEPTDDEGRALAAFRSGRWSVSREHGLWFVSEDGRTFAKPESERPSDSTAWDLTQQMWDAHEDKDSLPFPLLAALALHELDWLDADGKLTQLGERALERWIASADDGPDARSI